MKKRYLIVVIVISCVVIIGLLMALIVYLNDEYHNSNQPNTTVSPTFDIAEYSQVIAEFSCDKNVGQIDDESTAIEKAKKIWIDKYGTVNGEPYDPIQDRKIAVSFDSNNNCWLVKVILPPNTLGATPHAIIQKDGSVIAVWMG